MNNIFGRIFGNSNKDKNPPDNIKLFELINNYIKDNKYENYASVVAELTNGNAFLLLPIYNENKKDIPEWTPAPEGFSIKWGTYFVDGLIAIAAFTSEEALFTWAQKPTNYIALPSKTVLEMCEKNEVRRVVIDSKLPTMIVLQNDE